MREVMKRRHTILSMLLLTTGLFGATTAFSFQFQSFCHPSPTPEITCTCIAEKGCIDINGNPIKKNLTGFVCPPNSTRNPANSALWRCP